MNDCQCHEIVVETENPTVELSVEPVNETEQTSFYNLDDVDWIGKVDSNGALVPSTKSMNIVFNGIKDVSEGHLARKFQENANVVSVSFPDLLSLSYQEALFWAFADCPNVVSASFPKLETVSGLHACMNMFVSCENLEELSLPKLKYATGNGCFNNAFASTKLSAVNLPELEEVGFVSFESAFYHCDLHYFNCPNLKKIGEEGFYLVAGDNYDLTEIDLGSLEEVGDNGLLYAFRNSKLESIVFPKLNTIGFCGFTETFSGVTTLTELSFPALTAESVMAPDNADVEPYTGYYFYGMLVGCSDVTVHLPAETEDFLYDREYILDGFGGTNTTTLFDINPCYVEINVIGSQNYHIYVYGIEKFSPFTTGESDKEYYVISPTQHIIYFGMLTGLVVDETTTFTADLTEANKEIVLNVPSDTTLQVKYGDLVMPLENVSSGVYSFLTNGSGQEFSYVITESPTTRRTEGTFTIDGSSMSITLTPTPKEWVAFTRPNLSADGTVGGDAFAVWSSGTYSTSASRQAWRAVDGNTSASYYWYSKNEANPIYEFYNPYPIKVASLTFYWTSTSYCAKSFVLDVSNDGSTWTSLGTFTLDIVATATANINSANAYKYYRMTFTKQSTYLRLKELEMSATKYE